MSDQRERRAESLFLDALEHSKEERDGFLVEQCGEDVELLDLVRRRLQVHFDMQAHFDSPEGFLAEVAPASGFDGTETLSGTRLDDFELLEEIGRGGMGLVFRARQISLDRDVAVKVLPPALASARLRMERFRREAFAVSKLQHPGVVPILSYGESGGIVYYAMELVQGPSLAKVIRCARDEEELPGVDFVCGDPAEAARMTVAILRAVEHVHSRGVLHRDIKPHNILLDPSGAPRLIDFGLAKDFELSGLTRSGETAGTPHYMSPEQARTIEHPIDTRTDLYSVGAVLYELLGLQPPFSGCGLAEIFLKIATEEPRSLRSQNSQIPRELEVICFKALRKEPEARYATAKEMAEDLERFLAGESIVARPPSLGELTKKALVKRRALLKVAPALLLAGGLTGAWFYGQRAQAAEAATWPTVTLTWDAPGEVTVYTRRLDGASLSFGPAVEVDSTADCRLEISLEPVEQRLVVVAEETGAFAELRLILRRGNHLERFVHLVPTQEVLKGVARVPEGSVDLGHALYSTFSSASRQHIEVPAFYMDTAVVTRGEFKEFLIATGRDTSPKWIKWLANAGLAKRSEQWELPATLISWHDAQRYAEWKGKRLPTLVEWDLAMRQSIDAWASAADEETLARLNLLTEDQVKQGSINDVVRSFARYGQAARAGSALFGAPGMYHPVGNVEEWTETVHAGEMPEAMGAMRVLMGLSYRFPRDAGLHGSDRLASGMLPRQSSWDIGFRCAKSVDGI